LELSKNVSSGFAFYKKYNTNSPRFDFAVVKDLHKKFVEDGDGMEEDEELGANVKSLGLLSLDMQMQLEQWIQGVEIPEKECAKKQADQIAIGRTDVEDESGGSLYTVKSNAWNAKVGSEGSGDVLKSEEGDKSESSISTLESTVAENCHSIQRYVRDLLNHKLPFSPPPATAFVAPVMWNKSPKMASAERWHVTHDVTVTPRRLGLALIFESNENVENMVEGFNPLSKKGIQKLADAMKSRTRIIKSMWRVGGVELVSSVLKFREEEKWMPMLKQVQRDLTRELAFYPLEVGNGPVLAYS